MAAAEETKQQSHTFAAPAPAAAGAGMQGGRQARGGIYMSIHPSSCLGHTADVRPVLPSSVHSPAKLHFGPVVLLSSSILYSYNKPSAVATTSVTCGVSREGGRGRVGENGLEQGRGSRMTFV